MLKWVIVAARENLMKKMLSVSTAKKRAVLRHQVLLAIAMKSCQSTFKTMDTILTRKEKARPWLMLTMILLRVSFQRECRHLKQQGWLMWWPVVRQSLLHRIIIFKLSEIFTMNCMLSSMSSSNNNMNRCEGHTWVNIKLTLSKTPTAKCKRYKSSMIRLMQRTIKSMHLLLKKNN